MKKSSLNLYKAGKFYNAFGDDGLIIHYLLGYKFVTYRNSAGFPESALMKVKTTLQNENIPYSIYEKDDLIENYEGSNKSLKNTLMKAIRGQDIEKRVENAKKKLNSYTPEQLEKLLEVIENAE